MADYKDSDIYKGYTKPFQALINTTFRNKRREWIIVPMGTDEEHHYKWLASSYFIRDLCKDAPQSAQYGFYTVLPYITIMWEGRGITLNQVRETIDGQNWAVLFRSGNTRDNTSALFEQIKGHLQTQFGASYEIIEGVEISGNGYNLNRELREKLEKQISDFRPVRKIGVFKKK
ncbi:MAG: hypothetical protein CL963_01585 [Euryarchaeota archaeon]|jgi:hypothetical protein|nr:hypothetical protein [Euryarchaeota archaeon]HIK01061.1 hypothetical protein [Candidatus Undinarchaeales archaeon ERR594346 U_76725]|tara:strand:+ start:19325 stop:19846 length:522 start_codon:yes stop_codon:yes gene_type:complete